jgi:hypothetical protein
MIAKAPRSPRPNMALQRTRRPRFRSGRSLRSIGSPLNARPLAAAREGLVRLLPRRPDVQPSQRSVGLAATSPKLNLRRSLASAAAAEHADLRCENVLFPASASSSVRG